MPVSAYSSSLRMTTRLKCANGKGHGPQQLESVSSKSSVHRAGGMRMQQLARTLPESGWGRSGTGRMSVCSRASVDLCD